MTPTEPEYLEPDLKEDPLDFTTRPDDANTDPRDETIGIDSSPFGIDDVMNEPPPIDILGVE